MLESLFVSNTFSKYIRTDVNPQLGNYSDFGRAIEYGNRAKRKKHLTPDHIQTHIVFGDDDREVADMEAQDWEGEHRQTEEPPEGVKSEE